MTGNIDATIRAALLLNANHLLQAAVSNLVVVGPEALSKCSSLSKRFEQSAQTYMGLYHEYNTVDVWSDTDPAWDVGEWTQVQTALQNMSEFEAKPYHKQQALDMVEHRLGMAEQDAEQEAIEW